MVIPRTLTCLRPILQGKCIFLYCLPLHSSHLTQPLNVSFYKPLKAAWAKACTSYCTQNLGTKQWSMNFSYIFREAWISCVMLSTTVNGSVLCPFNPCSFLEKSTLLMPKSSITVMGSCCYWRCTRKGQSTEIRRATWRGVWSSFWWALCIMGEDKEAFSDGCSTTDCFICSCRHLTCAQSCLSWQIFLLDALST